MKEIKEKKCVVSPQYGKNNNKNLHFYCENCGEEMGYDEDRVCRVKQPQQKEIKEEILKEVEFPLKKELQDLLEAVYQRDVQLTLKSRLPITSTKDRPRWYAIAEWWEENGQKWIFKDKSSERTLEGKGETPGEALSKLLELLDNTVSADILSSGTSFQNK